jgi:AraC-like DNA-binding protein
MHLARRWLETEQPSVLEVAERCGYQSEAAFSKAFKRMTGVGPGEYRRIAAIRKRGAVGDAPAAGEDSGEAAG